MKVLSNDSMNWFAARTKRNQERTVKTKLEQLGVDHFIPFRKEVRSRKGRKVELEIPVIPNIVFIYTDYRTGLSLVNEYGVKVWYIRAIGGNSPLIVPQKQLDDFRSICENNVKYTITYDFSKGDRVRVSAGPLTGLEGVLVSDRKNGGRLILRLDSIASFELTVPVKDLEKI